MNKELVIPLTQETSKTEEGEQFSGERKFSNAGDEGTSRWKHRAFIWKAQVLKDQTREVKSGKLVFIDPSKARIKERLSQGQPKKGGLSMEATYIYFSIGQMKGKTEAEGEQC